MAKLHLAILKKPYLEAILTGTKTIESRFMKTNRQPFGSVSPGDMLIFKQSSGPVRATAIAAEVQYYENLTPQQMAQIKAKHNADICGNDEYWEQKACCKYGVLIRLAQVKPTELIRIQKKDWRAWVVLTKGKDLGLHEHFEML